MSAPPTSAPSGLPKNTIFVASAVIAILLGVLTAYLIAGADDNEPEELAAAATQVPVVAEGIAGLIKTAVEGEYSQNLRAGNGAYVLAHLDASAKAFYGDTVCADFFSRIVPDAGFQISVASINGPASWTWQAFGETVGTIQDAYTLNVTLTQLGQSANATVHFAWDAEQQELRVFSPCRRSIN